MCRCGTMSESPSALLALLARGPPASGPLLKTRWTARYWSGVDWGRANVASLPDTESVSGEPAFPIASLASVQQTPAPLPLPPFEGQEGEGCGWPFGGNYLTMVPSQCEPAGRSNALKGFCGGALPLRAPGVRIPSSPVCSGPCCYPLCLSHTHHRHSAPDSMVPEMIAMIITQGIKVNGVTLLVRAA